MSLNLQAPEPALALQAAPPVQTVEAKTVVDGHEKTIVDELPAVEDATKNQVAEVSSKFVLDLKRATPKSIDFNAKVQEITNLGKDEIVRSAQGNSRLMERSIASMKKDGGDAQTRVASTLSDLRSTVDDLTPNAEQNSTARKIFGFIPGGRKLQKYFQKYESAQAHLNAIIRALETGKIELEKDNASLEQERANLWNTMLELRDYVALAQELDVQISTEIASLRASGDTLRADALEQDALFAVRQRTQDLLTQIAVSIQAYLAMKLVQDNNRELIKGVERAKTTTLTALRTAVIVAQALENQKLVLDQIDAINATTNNLIEQTSRQLRQNAVRTQEQAVNSGVSIEVLQSAFDNIYATMEEIDNFRRQANDNMAQTIGVLETQIDRAQPYLERARQQDELAQR